MSFEYTAKITVTRMNGNGDVYKKSFNGTCTVGVNKKVKASIARKAEAYLQAVSQSQGSKGRLYSPRVERSYSIYWFWKKHPHVIGN